MRRGRGHWDQIAIPAGGQRRIEIAAIQGSLRMLMVRQPWQAPAAYMSNGEGGFAKNKTYFVNQVHLMSLNAANAQTAKDANGLFNGCPAPVNCWIPQLVGGQEWFPIPKG